MVQVLLTGHSRYCIVCRAGVMCIWAGGCEWRWFGVHRWYSCRDMATTRSNVVVLVVYYNLHKISASLGLSWDGPSIAYRPQSVLHRVQSGSDVHLGRRVRMEVVWGP